MSINKRKKVQAFAKKVSLQRRLQEKSIREQKRLRFVELGIKDLYFLDVETSIAIFIKAKQAGLTKLMNFAPNQKWQHKTYTTQFNELFHKIEMQTEKVESDYGYLFLYDWELTGALIFNSKTLYKSLNEILYHCEDDLIYYSSDLSAAILINGDRTGTGDYLNYLEVSALNQNYKI